MQTIVRLVAAASLTLVVSGAALRAQAPADPSGHWTGAIHVPAFNGASSRDVGIEIDLAKNRGGELAATFTRPDQNVTGLPLGDVSFDGTVVSFELRANGGGVFKGRLTDATSIVGDFITTEGGYTVPFDLARTGDAKIAPAPKSAAIGKDLEGVWNGTIDFQGKKERLVLTMRNQPDGSSAGTVLDVDGGNVEIPIAMRETAADVTIEVAAVAATFTGALKGTELAGTWNQGPFSLPVTFTRGAK
jgi:hypothetical protein